MMTADAENERDDLSSDQRKAILDAVASVKAGSR